MSDKQNCNTCKYIFECENRIIDGVILTKWEHRENYKCDKYKSRYIEYPITVSKINYGENFNRAGRYTGKFVSVRPCAKEYGGKTYLGLYLGDLPFDHYVTHNSETKELNVGVSLNPANFIFELNKIIYGCESWWGVIESEEELKEITKDDINNIWYVKALKALDNRGEV